MRHDSKIDFLVVYGRGTVILTPQHQRASEFLELQLGQLFCKWDRGQIEIKGLIASPLFEAMEEAGLSFSAPFLAAA